MTWSCTIQSKTLEQKIQEEERAFYSNSFQKANEEVDNAAQANYMTGKVIAKAGGALTEAQFLGFCTVWGRCFE